VNVIKLFATNRHSNSFGILAQYMTSPFLDYLADKQIPGFALLKNVTIENVPRKGMRISGFDESHYADSYGALQQLIPSPKLLGTREAKEQASYKYSEKDLEEANFVFDDLPVSLTNESSDRELFGECFTIFWVVPAEKEVILELLLADFKANSEIQISAEQIKATWNEKLNRIFFHFTGEADTIHLAMIQEEIEEDLIEAITSLPNAPDESAWEILNEDIFWGEDDEY
jgi:hypothetical protein